MHLLDSFLDYFKQSSELLLDQPVFTEPVDLEPTLHLFHPPMEEVQHRFDDGVKGNGFIDFINGKDKVTVPNPSKQELRAQHYEPPFMQDPVSLMVSYAEPTKTSQITAQTMLSSLSKMPLSFEIFAHEGKVVTQYTCSTKHVQYLIEQLRIFYPDAQITKGGKSFRECISLDPIVMVDLGLTSPHMLPLRMNEGKLDPLMSMIGTLRSLQKQELGLVQIIIQPVQNQWAQVFRETGHLCDTFGVMHDVGDLPKVVATKTESTLYACIIRCASQSPSIERAKATIFRMIASLRNATQSPYNSLSTLSNEGYSLAHHIASAGLRCSFRPGMIISAAELAVLMHPTHLTDSLTTDSAVLALPDALIGKSFVLGTGEGKDERTEISLSEAHRLRHCHVIGASGSGKTTLLKRMIVQDMEAGSGCMLLDPHGDLVEEMLEYVHEHRKHDVVVIDPADADYPIGINILSATTELERITLASDLVGLFKRLSSSWGSSMHNIFSNAVDAFLSSTKPGTLFDLKTFLTDENFRRSFLKHVEDPFLLSYWLDEFPKLRKNAYAPVLTRLDTFLRPKVIRNMMMQKTGLDFAYLIASNKLIFVKLSHGLIGKANSYLLGTMLVAKLHQAIKARQGLAKSERKPFYLYIDEFQNYITPSMEDILSGARKYGLGMIMAHQHMQQVIEQSKEIYESILANAGTRICFRLGDTDAKKLAGGFAHFEEADLKNLGTGKAIMRVGKAENDLLLTTYMLPEQDTVVVQEKVTEILEHSRSTYAKSRVLVEQDYFEQFHKRKEELKVAKEEVKKKVPRRAKNGHIQPEEVSSAPLIKDVHKVVPEQEIPPILPASSSKLSKHSDTEESIRKRLSRQEGDRKHVRIQKQIKELGQKLNFLSVMEKPTPDGKGRVDVSLVSGEVSIAVEVSDTTGVEHEIRNIRKCLDAGYTHILSISEDVQFRNCMDVALKKVLPEKDLEKVHCFQFSQIKGFLIHVAPKESTEEVIKGYTVSTSHSLEEDPVLSKQKQKMLKDILMR